MTRWFALRLLRVIVVMWLSVTVVFVALYVWVDPVKVALPLTASRQQVVDFRRLLGLDRSLPSQYGHFLSGAVRGNFGTSLWLGSNAFTTAIHRVPATAEIAALATLIGVVGGLIVGTVAGRRPGSWMYSAGNVVAYFGVSLAEFWVAIMVILLFAVKLHILPTSGTSQGFKSMILPVGVLSIRPFSRTTQMVQTSVAAETQKDYVTTARSKGLSESQVAVRHILRNAVIPVAALAVYDFSVLFTGTAVVVETIFAWPGIGQLAVGALQNGDIFLVEAIAVIAAVIVGVLNLIADSLYMWLDPRTRINA